MSEPVALLRVLVALALLAAVAGLWRRVWFGEPIPGTPFAERAAARAQAAEAKSGATPAINASK